MKTPFLLVLSNFYCAAILMLYIPSSALAQLNARQTKVTAYGITFNASDLDGFKGSTLAPDVSCLAPTLDFPITRTSLYSLLGETYSQYDLRHPKELLDMQFDYDVILPILDSIDYKYYKDKSLFILRENKFKNDTSFTIFDNRFKTANNKQRRNMLYKSRFTKFRPYLEETRFIESSGIVSGTASRDLQRSYALSFSDSITADIKQVAAVKQKITAAIRDSIQKHSSTKFTYHKVNYTTSYLGIASDILKNAYDNNITARYNDRFSKDLATYLKAKKSAIITGAAILQASFETVDFRKLESSIKGAIEANLKKNEVVNIEQIQAKINGRYFRKLTTGNAVTIPDKFYYLRLAYSKELEVGAGSPDNPDAVCSD